MTVQRYVGDLLVGTNAERTGGTWTGIPAGWRYVETDTKRVYVADGSGNWNEQVVSASVLTGQLGVPAGGTGAATLTGVLKGNGTSAVTAAAQLAVADGGTGAATLTGILKGNGTSAVTAVTAPSGAIVGDTDSQTLTNKTLTAPIISSISNTGTVTLPTATDTLIAKATTDILTNKSIDATTNTFSNVQVGPKVKKWSTWMGPNNQGTTGLFAGTNSTAIAVGTGGSSTTTRVASVGVHSRWTTGATANGLGGVRVSASSLTERTFNPDTEWKPILIQTANTRVYIGYTSSTAAPASATDPLANLSGVGFFYDSTVDNQWHIAQNSGGASSDRTTIATIATADTSVHTFRIKADNANTKFQYSYDGGALTDINTVIPAASTGLGWTWFIENPASGAAIFGMYYVQSVQDG